MMYSQSIQNKVESLKLLGIRFAYIVAPVIGFIVTKSLNKRNLFDEIFISNVINLSGILAGFLFTSMGIMISLPDNKFTAQLSKSGYLKIVYRTMTVGILSFLIAMIIGMFRVDPNYTSFFFIIGVSETFLSSYYLFRISHFSSISK